MFQIRPEQLKELSQVPMDSFKQRVLEHLTSVYPEFVAAMEDAAVLQWIDSATRRAISYGIEYEPEVVGYIELTVELGQAFEMLPGNDWARDILLDEDLTDIEKIEELRAVVDPDIEDELEETAGLQESPEAGA